MRRKRKKVSVKGLHIYFEMRHGLRGIYQRHGAGFVCQADDLGRGVDRLV